MVSDVNYTETLIFMKPNQDGILYLEITSEADPFAYVLCCFYTLRHSTSSCFPIVLFSPPRLLSSPSFPAPGQGRDAGGRTVKKKRFIRQMEFPCFFQHQFEAASIAGRTDLERWVHRSIIYTSRPSETTAPRRCPCVSLLKEPPDSYILHGTYGMSQ